MKILYIQKWKKLAMTTCLSEGDTMNLIEFGSISHITKGKKPVNQSNERLDGFKPYVDIEAFETGKVKTFTDGKKCLPCNNGEILIVCDGSRSGFVGRAIEGYVGSTLAIISADGMSSDYLYYFLQGKYALLNTKKKGTGTPHLDTNILNQQKLIVPPVEEQKHIVSRIEELFSQLDTAVETLKNTKQQLAVYRQAVLNEAFASTDELLPFGEIMISRLGKMLDKEKNTGTPQKYLRNLNVRWFSFDLSDLLEMRIMDDEADKYTVTCGDLIVCEGGEPGRCAVWEKEEPLFYQKALHRVRFTNNSNAKFYMYYLWFYAQTGQLKQYFTGSGIKHLTGQSLVKVPVPNADRYHQDKIVDKIEENLSVCDNIEKTVDTALQQAEAMRQSILKKAFEGDLK